MKKIVIDLDNTLTVPSGEYGKEDVRAGMIEKLAEFRDQGFQIVVFTSRNMRTFNGELGKINIHTLPIIIDWLKEKEIPFDEVIVGKPWCGDEGFYVDDRAIRPGEFLLSSPKGINKILDA